MASKQYTFPESCNLSNAEIAKMAEHVARELKLNPGADLEPVVEILGGRIECEYIDPWSVEPGSIFIESLGDFKIVLPSHTSAARDRFTVAHELGHYFLHFVLASNNNNQITPMSAQRYGSGLVEIEANIFAASFLMPEKEFKEKHATFNGHKLLLADYFKVSPSAAAVREKVLKLDG